MVGWEGGFWRAGGRGSGAAEGGGAGFGSQGGRDRGTFLVPTSNFHVKSIPQGSNVNVSYHMSVSVET